VGTPDTAVNGFDVVGSITLVRRIGPIEKRLVRIECVAAGEGPVIALEQSKSRDTHGRR
jgi:hypothetical protein